MIFHTRRFFDLLLIFVFRSYSYPLGLSMFIFKLTLLPFSDRFVYHLTCTSVWIQPITLLFSVGCLAPSQMNVTDNNGCCSLNLCVIEDTTGLIIICDFQYFAIFWGRKILKLFITFHIRVDTYAKCLFESCEHWLKTHSIVRNLHSLFS